MLDTKTDKKKKVSRSISTYLNCFGAYNSENPICRKKCVMAIKCLVEQKKYLEVLFSDAIFENDEQNGTTQ